MRLKLAASGSKSAVGRTAGERRQTRFDIGKRCHVRMQHGIDFVVFDSRALRGNNGATRSSKKCAQHRR